MVVILLIRVILKHGQGPTRELASQMMGLLKRLLIRQMLRLKIRRMIMTDKAKDKTNDNDIILDTQCLGIRENYFF